MTTCATDPSSTDPTADSGGPWPLVLVIAWCEEDADRVGEVFVVPNAARGRRHRCGLGRGAGGADRLVPYRIRPGHLEPRPPLASHRLSRDQLVIEVDESGARARNAGRGELRVDGVATEVAALTPGALLEIHGRLMLFVDRHPVAVDSWDGREDHPFGAPDADGFVGECPAAWEIRRQLDFLGRRRTHVLIRGPSGSGKELVAGGLHRRSHRTGPLVSRNATTLPPGIVDAELFGNVRGYPNAGMPARPGIVGAADGGTLFLDEIGDLPKEVQPHLLRLLDSGEYQTLGDHRKRVADLRVVGATNRDTANLRDDLLARFPVGIELPGLNERRSDLPLLARHLVSRIVAAEPDLAARFVDASGVPRIGPGLVRALYLRSWTTHLRELQALLWSAMLSSRGDTVEAQVPRPEPVAPAVVSAEPTSWEAYVGAAPDEIPAAALVAALAAHHGHQGRTAAALGLSSRFVLHRLLKRLDLRLGRPS